MKGRKKNSGRLSKTAALVFIIFCSIAFLEAVLRAWFSQFPYDPIEKWRYETVFQQVSSDPRSYVHLPSRSMKFMNTTLTTNSNGLRDREFSLEKPDDVYRILVVGNSTTLGWGIPFEKTFAKQLESLLNQPGHSPRRFSTIEIINTGIGDYSVEQQLYSFLIDGSRYDPDAIILCFSLSDAEATRKGKFNPISRSSYLVKFISTLIEDQSHWWLDGHWPEWSYVARMKRLYSGQNWNRYRSTIAELVHELQNRRIHLIPVLLPDFQSLPHYPFNEIHWKVASLFAELGYYPLDLLPFLEEQAPGSAPNEETHAIIAKSIDHWIEKRRLIR